MSVDRLQEMRKRKRMAAGGGQAVEMQPVIKVCFLFFSCCKATILVTFVIVIFLDKANDIIPHTLTLDIAHRIGTY